MIERVALDVSSSNSSAASWKTITKGKRSKKPVAKNVNGITKLGNRSPKRVGDFMVSDYEKFNGSITGKLISKEAEHIPPKKRHVLQSPSQPQLFRHSDESLLPPPLTPSPHGDSKLQSKGFCGSAAFSSRDCVDPINKADFPEVVDQKLYNPHDFSGIALLAAAACIDGIDDDDAGHLKVIEELPTPSMYASSEPITGSVSMEQQSFLPGDSVKENTDTKCSSPKSLQENEDVAMKELEELEASKVDRRYWDLNVMMDDWQEPLDCSGEEAPSVDVSGCKLEVEKPEEEGCKKPVISGNDSSTTNPRPVNQTEQVKSELVCSADMVTRGSAILKESPTNHFNDPTSGAHKESTFGDNISSSLGSPAVEMQQISRVFVDEKPAHLVSENISIVRETAKDINQTLSSNSVNICMENIGSAVWERYGSNTDSVVIGTSELPDNCGSNSSPVQPNSNDFSASSSSSHSVTCTLKGQCDSISVPDIVASGSLSHFVPKELTSIIAEHCLSNAGEEVRATLPVSSPKDVGSLSDIPTSGSAKIGSSLDDCRNSDVSQDGHCYTVGSKDMTEFQDGNDSPYEDGELRVLMPCPWEENEMDDLDNECVDYESDGRGMDSDGADYPGSEVVEAGSEASLGVEKRGSSVREVSFPVVNVSGSVKRTTEMRYMKEDTEKTDIGGIKSTTRSFPKMGQFMRSDNLRRRHSYGHLDEFETAGSYSEEMNPRNKGKLQPYGDGSESLHLVGRTGYLQQSNRSDTYSRPIRYFSHDKFMGRKRSTYSVRERNGETDKWGDDWSSRNRLAAGRQGPDGHSYNRPRNMTADSSDKLSGLNSEDNRQALYYSSKDLHREQNSRSTYERDDYYSVNRRASASTNRSRGSSGSHPQGVGRGFRNEYYNPSHENHASNSSRRPRYVNGHESSFSPPSGRSIQNPISRRRSRSRSRSRSPHPWHWQRERNQLAGRRHTRSPDFRSGYKARIPFDKPSLHGDYVRNFESPPRGRFPPQHNRRWVKDHNHVENPKNMGSPVRMPQRPFRYDSAGSAGRYKEDDYLGPRMRPARFPPPAGTRRGCNFDNYDDRRRDDRDDRADVICRSRHLDANVAGSRFRHDPESSDCQDDEDARNTESRDVPRISREDRVSCKE